MQHRMAEPKESCCLGFINYVFVSNHQTRPDQCNNCRIVSVEFEHKSTAPGRSSRKGTLNRLRIIAYNIKVFIYIINFLFISFIRNPDFREVTLEKDGKEVLRFAIANGFRNIQNLVQKLKRGKSPYHYVEVMACPSGES